MIPWSTSGRFLMTNNDLNFFCTRLRCKMAEAACIDRQRKAYRMRQDAKAGKIYDDTLYGVALFCLSCTDGAQLRRRLKVPLTEKPRPKIVPKPRPKPKPKPKAKPKAKPEKPKPNPVPPIRVEVPIWERPLCSECGRYAARVHGMCLACDRKERKAQWKHYC